MKKLILLFSLAFTIIRVNSQDYYPYNIGYTGSTMQTAKEFKIGFSGGSVSSTIFQKFVEDSMVMTGFRGNLKYFKKTFSKDLFASKGYYASYIELKWDIKNYADQITRFNVWRKKFCTKEDSVLIGSVSSDDRAWKDEYAESGVIYKYTLIAQGITKDFLEPLVNYVEGTGFRFPTGRVSGRVTFKGGTAVEGVNVYAETEDVLGGKSILLNGTDAYLGFSPNMDDPFFKFDTSFCFQAWFKPQSTGVSCLFEKYQQFKIMHQPGLVTFTAGSTSVTVNFNQKADTFFHVSALYTGDSIKLYVLYNNKLWWKSAVKITSSPSSNDNSIFIGKSSAGEYFKGNVDEIRIWHRNFTQKELIEKTGIYISGTEKGLTGYYRCDEGISNNAFDLSRSGFEFNEHHLIIAKGQWSTAIPFRAQLSFKGITDKNGNYIISGIPYATNGTTYRITPVFEVHKFDPTESMLFIGEGSDTHNSINFTDASSFPVKGNVRYRGTNFPVCGAFLNVDGLAAISSSGTAIMTDANGNFTVDVPIGKHFVSVTLNGHKFENSGRYPAPMPGIPEPLKDFQEPISGLKFIDTTLIKVIGRIVGGPVQAAKTLGMGKSKNNLGNATIVLSTQKQMDLSDSKNDTSGIWNQMYYKGGISCKAGSTKWLIIKDNPKEINISPDIITGEFVAWLLPEKYVITSAKAGTYIFGDEFKTVLDLTNSNEWQKKTDSAFMGIKARENKQVDSVYRIDTVGFQSQMNLIYREMPSVSVTAKDGSKVFWDKNYIIDGKTINLNDADGNSLLGYPVFTQRGIYSLKISVFEKYVNSDNENKEDLVPVSDGKIQIQNALAIDESMQIFDLNSQGQVSYSFIGGLPNITTDATGGYTKTMSMLVLTGNNGSIKTNWPETGAFKAYIFGGMPTGNNFVTTGPTSIDMILRDPPGTNSYSFLEKGTTYSSSHSYAAKGKWEGSEKLKHQFGAEMTSWVGVGIGIVNTVEYNNSLTLGVEHEVNWSNGNSTTVTTTTTERWQTSDGSDYVGAMGDLFIGHATNIVYGKSIFISLIPVSNCDGCVGNEISGYKVGKSTGIRMNPKFGTSFIFSQNHIVNYLIPNLEMLRDAFFKKGDGVYVSNLSEDANDYGRLNRDTINKKTFQTDRKLIGDSYTVTIPSNWNKDSAFVDSVKFFNQQIADWKKVLQRNEREKINATSIKNISFDGGASYEYSISYDTSTNETNQRDFMISPVFAGELGFEVKGFGLSFEFEEKLGGGADISDSKDTSKAITFGYVLADENEGDYISLQVKEPPSKTGPIFEIKGGQTGCPWEDAVVTKYEQPGKIISQATMQREKPFIEIENPMQANVPEDQIANFNLLLQNASETGDGMWIAVFADNTTNQDGANIMIDGSPIGNERLINVPAGETVKKVLSVGKTLPGVYNYENIRIIGHSTCQYDPNNPAPDIGDTTYLSAYFKPVCSSVKISSPGDPWTINTISGDTQVVSIGGYNLAHPSFQKILFQYKPVSSSDWTTDNTFYVNAKDTVSADKPWKYLNNQPSVNYNWDLSSLMDRQYQIRVKSVCIDGTENNSLPFTGIKDTKPPKVFGTPQPADGILSPNDDVLLTFDEPIQAGLITPYNFSIKDVLNGFKKNHNSCLYFSGNQSYANVMNGIPLANKSFTIEYWAKRGSTGKQVVFTQGKDLEFGFTASDNFYAKLGETTITTKQAYNDITTWQHWAVSYNKETQIAEVYMNDSLIMERMPINGDILGEGKMLVGKSINDDNYFNGYIHELRIWEKVMPFATVYANMYKGFNGQEVGLAGYWPMDESDGTKAEDLARNRHAVLHNTVWRVFPAGKSVSFNGNSDYITIPIGKQVVITKDMDYTIEFWFKAPKQSNAVILSNGKADGANENYNEIIIGANPDGEIYVKNKNLAITATGKDFLDNAWHHLALVMNRAGNLTLYIDGNQQAIGKGLDFGGISGANMCVGALMYKAQGIQHDQYFSGLIDELRIWKLARELKQIKLDKNAHLSGKEVGLCAYYPFEYYAFNMGVPEINETFVSASKDTSIANGVIFSDDAPNIKDARPLQDIAFEWVVNKDKINIIPKEDNQLIEKTTVEFTVERIEDLNENRMTSPVTWTAYINKNQVLWDATELELSKKVYDSLTFKVDILNLGGKQQNFSIQNLPPWLSASVKSGSLAPDSKLTVTFIVDEALNIGKYQESVYLHSDFGFDEKLLINLNVFKPCPDWKVNKSQFQYTMNVIAQLKIDDEISIDPDDMVGAFVNGQCRGVTKLKYFESYDKFMAFIDIFSNKTKGDTVKFRIWDASEGIIHTQVTPTYIFVPNDVKGSVVSPIILTTSGNIINPITLTKGWNWVSFNLNSAALKDADVMFSKKNRTSGDQIKGPVDATGAIIFDNYSSNSWSKNFSAKGGFKTGYMYMVQSSKIDTIQLEGTKISNSSPISISSGWNWLGYTNISAMTINDAFAFYTPAENDLIKSQYGFAMYNTTTGWLGSLTFLKPGEGYMFKTSKSDQLTYPESGLYKNAPVESNITVPNTAWKYDKHEYPTNMSVIAKVILPGNIVAGNDWSLGAFVGNECRGIASALINNDCNCYTYFISVSGNQNENISYRIINNSTNKELFIKQITNYIPDEISGSIKDPVVLNIADKDELNIVDIALNVSPNPFNDYLKMEIYSPTEGDAIIQLYNSLGVSSITDKIKINKGWNTVKWNQNYCRRISPGVYCLKLLMNNQVSSILVVKN